MKFVHAADIHLAKPFGRFDEDTRAALRGARLEALLRIGEVAVENGASFILLAGDTFDVEAPPSKTVRRALSIMGEFSEVTWVLMPGNHDSLAAVDLWERIVADCSGNVRAVTDRGVIEIGDEVAVLCCPPRVKNPGSDMTEWMGAAETGKRFRIGLAHGGVVDFDSEEGSTSIIPPNRAEISSLDYLALGDWHGQMKLTPRTWYSGAPEADGFKGHPPAGVLLVEIDKPGALPVVAPVPTGRFTWQILAMDCLSGQDPIERLYEVLPVAPRENVLLRLLPTGRLGLLDHSRLREACERLHDDFHHFEVSWDDVGIEQVVDDLDLIAESGALRNAADSLFEATGLEGRTAEDVHIAELALTHLFHIAQEENF